MDTIIQQVIDKYNLDDPDHEIIFYDFEDNDPLGIADFVDEEEYQKIYLALMPYHLKDFVE
jgi:hypothetical protein